MSPTPIITKYPLDPTGQSPDNLILNEEHTLPNRPIRALAPKYGAFFSDSLVVREKISNKILVRDIDYYPAEMYHVPTAKYGKEICSVILIINQDVQPEIEIDYQVLGGAWESSQDAIIQMLNGLNLDDRPVSWGSILNKPSEFNPAHHLHDSGDIYGFEYVVAQLERIKQAIIIGDAVSHDRIYDYIDSNNDWLKQYVDNEIQELKNYSDNTFQTQSQAEIDHQNIISYVDQQDSALESLIVSSIQNLKDYSDTTFQTKSQANIDHTNLENSLKLYTDEKTSDALTEAKEYADEHYVRPNSSKETSLRIVNGVAQIRVGNEWKQFWPPLWQ